MNRELRRYALMYLVKKAGLVSELVERQLADKEKPRTYQVLGSVGAGSSVMVPNRPIKLDGTVDIIFQIRGISQGDTRAAAGMGKNAVVVTLEKGGAGSKENLSAYGKAEFINNAVSKILGNLQQKFPDKNVRLGKLTISSFSGGGSATAKLLMERNNLVKGTEPPKFVFIDGLHSELNGPVMKAIVDYAKEVKDNPKSGELSIVHSAVVPGNYASTTETAHHILNSTGLIQQRVSDKSGPSAQVQQGGLRVVQLYDKPAPYMAKDPRTGQMKPNVPGTAGYQHLQSLHWGLKNLV